MNRRIIDSAVGALVVATVLVLAIGGTLAVGAAEVTTTVEYSGSPVPIPDGTGLSGDFPGDPATATIEVTGIQGQIIDVDLLLGNGPCSGVAGDPNSGISHNFIGDLELTLVAPDGTEVLVIDNAGGGGGDFCQTLLDDDAGARSIQTATQIEQPFDGTWSPANPLSAFDGIVDANGTWTLRAQDFFGQEVGDILAFSVIITTQTTNEFGAIKTVSGDFVEGGEVTYSVVLTNSGSADSLDNAGDEFVDVLADGLVLVSASADVGAAVADVASNTVSWNGSVPAGGSATVTIVATVAPGTAETVISNQGTVSFDADVDGVNESTVLTDDVAGGTLDPTTFTVAVLATNEFGAIKTVSGDFVEGGEVTYSVVLTNSGSADSLDNAGDEFVDVLADGLVLVSASADVGAAVADVASNTVSWNGSVPAGGSATVTIVATVAPGTAETVISNQGTVSFDADVDGVNESTVLTDDVAGGTLDPTTFTVAALPIETTTTTTTTTTVLDTTSTTAPVTPSTTAANAPTTAGASTPTTTGAVSADSLPRTGGQTDALVFLAIGLILTGSGLVLVSIRNRRGKGIVRT